MPAFNREIFAVHFAIGPWHLDLEGRAVFLMLMALAVLVVAALPVFLSGKSELRRRWTTWALILPVIGVPMWMGPGPTAALAALLALQAVREYVGLVNLPLPEETILMLTAVAYPLAAWLRPSYLGLVPLVALLGAAPAVLSGAVTDGLRRAALTAFGTIWLSWSLANLVILGRNAFLVCFAAAATDVAAWCGGTGLRRFGWARRAISPLSPNKSVGGLVGAALGGMAVLAVLGEFSPGLVIAVVIGAIGGDLVESMVKRQAGAKDAGTWLPGFGGLLDRVDSLLLILPLAAVLA
ncbi:MAG: phosphatidate cytidylyltransferase [Micrococcales bacterium]|nr:phosphatidate cytidylyltransferase [Micrococcales bacterium]